MDIQDAFQRAEGMNVSVGDTTFDVHGRSVICNGVNADAEEVAVMDIPSIKAKFGVGSDAGAEIIRWLCCRYYQDVFGDF